MPPYLVKARRSSPQSGGRQSLLFVLVQTMASYFLLTIFPRVVRAWSTDVSLRTTRRGTLSYLRTSSVSNSANNYAASSPSVLDTLCEWFQGDFDNYRQVVEDRKNNRFPREGGGHEHIHCTLVPVSQNSRLAAFYFEGRPTAIFRFRYYRMEMVGPAAADTVLYTLSKDLEEKLRLCADPMQWPTIFHQHTRTAAARLNKNTNMVDIAQAAIASTSVQPLPQCEVRWSWEIDPIQHTYVNDYSLQSSVPGLHAVMVHGQAVVDSQMMPGQSILIKDQLSLWPDQLWIHDRGLDPETGAYIYGNQRGIPYILQRVSEMATTTYSDKVLHERLITDRTLAWTLGTKFRTKKEYEENMAAIQTSFTATDKQ